MSTTQDARKKFTMAKAQENLYAVNVATVLCKVDTQKMGTVYNPYTSRPAVTNDTAANTTSYTAGTYTADADSLQINRRATSSEHVDSYDWKSVDFGLLADRGMNYGKAISQSIDGYVLNLPVTTSGVTTLDDAATGGTAGNPKTSSNSVIDDIMNTAIQELDLANSGSKRFAVVSAYEANDLRGYLQGTGNMVGDEVIRNGITSQVQRVGTTFSGVDVYQSNNVTQTVVLGLATNPTDGDTISIGNVVISFVAALTGASSEIHICQTVDATAAELAEFLNAPGTSVTEGDNAGISAATDEDLATLTRIAVSATATAASDIVTVTTKGTVKVSETLTDGTDTWGTPYRYIIIGDYGSINLYLPSKGMDYTEKEIGGKPGVELYMEQFYNAVIWTRMKDRVIAYKVN